MQFSKFSLRTKFLLVMITLTALAFCIVTYFSIERTKQFGEYADNACSILGQDAVNESKAALRLQAQEEIISLTTGQAKLIDTQIKRIAVEISMLANLCSRYTAQDNPQKNINRLCDNVTKDEPDDYLKYASWHVPTEYNLDNVVAELNKFSIIQPVLKFIWHNNPGSDIVYAASPTGLFVAYPWTRQPIDFDPRIRDWYTAASTSKSAVWVGPYISSSGNKLVLTCAKASRDANGKIISVCAIDIEIKKILHDLLANQLEPNSMAILIDASANILVRRNIDTAGRTWKNEFKKENLLASSNPEHIRIAKRMLSGKHGIEELNVTGEPLYYLAHSPISSNGWSLGIAIPKNAVTKVAVNTEKNIQMATIRNQDSIRAAIAGTQQIFCVIGSLLLLVIFITTFIFITKITRPISSLKNQAEQIGNGNLNQQIQLSSGDELEHLANVFNQMSADLKLQIENLKETFIKREMMNNELAVAKDIQLSSLPPAKPGKIHQAVEIQALMIPAKEIGGDFYDYKMQRSNTLYFAIGDVSGKGIPAALFMAMTKNLLAREAENGLNPNDILFNVNNILAKNNESCMFVTVFCAFMDLDSEKVVFANGGHNPPLLCRQGGTFEYLTPKSGMAIGPYPAVENKWTVEQISLGIGDTLFLYSDGVTEAMNSSGMVLGEARLRHTLNRCCQDSLELLIANVMLDIKLHTDNCIQSDDITIVALRRNVNNAVITGDGNA
jgi:sigma-B regulation protein RsbU (phosphoserine phosphatase)